jgi:hypothetical protein
MCVSVDCSDAGRVLRCERSGHLGIAEYSIVHTVLIALTAIVLLWKFKKSPEQIVVIAAAIMGLIIYPLLHSHS